MTPRLSTYLELAKMKERVEEKHEMAGHGSQFRAGVSAHEDALSVIVTADFGQL